MILLYSCVDWNIYIIKWIYTISHSLRQHVMPLMVANRVSFRGCLTLSLLLSHLRCSWTVQHSSCYTNTPPSVHHYHSQWLSNHCLFSIHSYVIGRNFLHSCFWWRLYWRSVGYMVILMADWSVISVCYHGSFSYPSIRTVKCGVVKCATATILCMYKTVLLTTTVTRVSVRVWT